METPTSDSDRRRAARLDLHLDVLVDGVEEAVTENVSSSGVLLRLPATTDVGTEFTMDMDIPEELGGGGGRVRFRARVVRVEDRPEGRAVGAKFLDWEVLT